MCFYYSCTSQNSIKTSSIFQMLHITWHNKKGGLNTLQYSVKFYVKIIIKNSLTAFSKVSISNFLFTDFEWMLTLFKVMQKHKCAISYKKGITFLQQLIILDRYISNGFNSRVLFKCVIVCYNWDRLLYHLNSFYVCPWGVGFSLIL